jgi:cytochrome c
VKGKLTRRPGISQANIFHEFVGFMAAILIAGSGIGGAASAQEASPRQSPGEKLVRANDCISCHAVDRKVVGPAYLDVAKKYRGHANAVQKLSQKIRDGGSGVWGPVPMTPHPALTSIQIKQMVEWILSLGTTPAKRSAGSSASPAHPEAAARQYSYSLGDGATVKLDFPLFVEGKEKDQKVTKDIFHGYEMYNSYCYRCHGQDATGSEIAPDLRHSLAAGMTGQQFLSTAMAGRPEKGMPSWAGFLSEDEVKNIYGYVKGRSLDLVPVGRPPSEMD